MQHYCMSTPKLFFFHRSISDMPQKRRRQECTERGNFFDSSIKGSFSVQWELIIPILCQIAIICCISSTNTSLTVLHICAIQQTDAVGIVALDGGCHTWHSEGWTGQGDHPPRILFVVHTSWRPAYESPCCSVIVPCCRCAN